MHPGQRCGGPWSNEDPVAAHRCPAGLWASPRPGWAADSASCGSPTTPDTFSSSRLFKQAALGFRLRSGGVGKERAVGDGPQVGTERGGTPPWPPWPAAVKDGRLGRSQPTSHLLLQAQDNLHRLLQDQQLGLRLIRLEVQLAHAAQLPEGLVNVPHAHPFPSVIGHTPLPIPQVLLLQGQHLICTAGSQHRASVSGGRPTACYV